MSTFFRVIGTVASIVAVIPSPIQPIAAAVAVGANIGAAVTAKRPANDQQGRQLQFKIGADMPIPFVMGRTAVGGSVVYRDTYGKDNSYQTFFIVLSASSALTGIGGIESFTADKATVPFAGMEATGYFAKWMWQDRQLGVAPAPAALSNGIARPPYGFAGTPPGWGPDAKLSGYAATSLSLLYDTKARRYAQGEPTPSWIVKGNLVYDPRRDSTYPGGSGPCRWADPSNVTAFDAARRTWIYSDTPALHGLMWRLGVWWRDMADAASRYQKIMGIGAPIDMIDLAAIVQAANVQEANGWRIGGEITSAQDKWEVLKLIEQTGGCEPIAVGAMMSTLVKAPRVSLRRITAADLADGMLSAPGVRRRSERLNGFRARFRSEPHGWEIVPIDIVQVPAYVAEDGRARTGSGDFSLCPDPDQCAELAAYEVFDSRELEPITLPLKPFAVAYRLGDCLTIDIEEIGLQNRDVIVRGRRVDPATGIVTLTFRTETAAKHPAALGLTGETPPTPTLTADPDSIAAPAAGSWTLTAGTAVSNGLTVPAIYVDGAVDNSNADGIVIEYRRVGDATWSSTGLLPPDTRQRAITPVEAGVSYEAVVRYRGRGIYSDGLLIGPVRTPDASADWDTGVTGPGKPEDGATVGAPPGTKVGDKPVENLIEQHDKALRDIDALFDGIETGEAASTAKRAAEAARDSSQAAQRLSEEARTQSQAARDAAGQARTGAEAARDAAARSSQEAQDLGGQAISKAEAARDAAAQSATNADRFATTASGQARIAEQSATDAGTKAGVATASADRASTKAAQADTSASRAAASETNAAGSAASAALAQEVTATTAQDAARTLAAQFPRAIAAGAFSPDASLAADRPAMPASSIVNGRIRQAPGISPQPYVVFLRSSMPHVPGKRWRLNAKVAWTSGNVQPAVWFYAVEYNAAGAITGEYITGPGKVLPAQTPVDLSVEHVMPDNGAAFTRFGILTNRRPTSAGDTTDGHTDVFAFYPEDIAAEKAATEAASAASRSASNAAASETVATQKASAASGSADTASTRAGQASASADRAALSETGAAGSASQAGRSEGLAATSARQAGDSATAASGSASLASSKATEAGTKATAASTSADRAETKAGAADASASRAAASETNAAGSASSAATSQQVTATTADEATRVLAAQFPRAINAGAFSPDASRAADRPAMPAGSVVEGRIRQAPGISPQPYVVFLRSPMPHVPGKRWRLNAKVAWTSGNVQPAVWFYAVEYNAAGLITGEYITGPGKVLPAQTPVDLIVEHVMPDNGAAFTRFGILTNRRPTSAGDTTDGHTDVFAFYPEDIAAEKAALDAASAASRSASNAAASETAAGQKASAASGSADIAATRAGQAGASADRAAASEMTIAGSKEEAAQSQRLAAESARGAAGSAIGAVSSASNAATKADEAGRSATAASQSRLEAQTANANAQSAAGLAREAAAQADAKAAAATESSTLAASIGYGVLNENPSFVNLADGPSTAATLAPRWSHWWQTPTISRRVLGKAGGNGWLIRAEANAPTGISTAQTYAAEPGIYVLRAAWELYDGSLSGCGAYISIQDANGEFAGAGFGLGDLAGDIDQSVPGLSPFRFIERTRLVYLTNPRMTRIALVGMQSWGGYGGQAYSQVAWHHLSLRKATESEIKSGRADANASKALSEVSRVSSALATEISALASEVLSTKVKVGDVEAGTKIAQDAAIDAAGKLAAGRLELASYSPGGRAAMVIRSDKANGAGIDLTGDLRVTGNVLIDGTLTAKKLDRSSMARDGASAWSGSISPARGQTVTVPWSLSLGRVPGMGRFIYEFTFVVLTNAGQTTTTTHNGKPYYLTYRADGGMRLRCTDAQGNIYTPRANGSDPVLGTTDFDATFTATVSNGNYDSDIILDGDYYRREISATYTLTAINLKATWVAI